MTTKSRLLRLLTWGALFLALCLAVLLSGFLALDRFVRSATDPFIYADAAALPASAREALVLGAQVLPGGQPSQALGNRLAVAVAAYKDGKVGGLLMSGDGRSRYYNEVASMRAYAKGQGVPEAAIITDPNGLRTYSSCYRARYEYGYSSLVIVTQIDHLRRALYTCRSLGIDAVGVAAPDFSADGGSRAYARYWLREKAALVLAWWDLNAVRPRQ